MSASATESAFEKRSRELRRDSRVMSEFAVHRYQHGCNSFLCRMRLRWRRMFLEHYCDKPPPWRVSLRRFGGARALPDFAVLAPLGCGMLDIGINLLVHPNVLAPLSMEFGPDPATWSRLCPTERRRRRHAERFGSAWVPFFRCRLHSPACIYSLARFRPGIRVIVSLREPAARLYTHWKVEHFLHRTRMLQLPFAATFSGFVNGALEAFPDCVPYSAFERIPGLSASIYWKGVRDCLEQFGKANVMVVDAAEYDRDASGVLSRIQDFVGLPRVPIPIPMLSPCPDEVPVDLPPPDAESLARLRTFFRPYNERLWHVLGRELAW